MRYRVLWIFQILHKYSTIDGNFLSVLYKISNQIESNKTINIEEYRKCDYGGIQESLLGFVRFLPTVKMMDVKIVSFPFVIGYNVWNIEKFLSERQGNERRIFHNDLKIY